MTLGMREIEPYAWSVMDGKTIFHCCGLFPCSTLWFCHNVEEWLAVRFGRYVLHLGLQCYNFVVFRWRFSILLIGLCFFLFR